MARKIKVLIADGIAHALEAGASGAIIKTADDNALITAIRKVSEGGRFISPKIQQHLRESPPSRSNC